MRGYTAHKLLTVIAPMVAKLPLTRHRRRVEAKLARLLVQRSAK